MNPELELFTVGLSHRTAPVEVRERCSIAGEALMKRLGALKRLEGVREVCVVSTCNRTEVLCVGAHEKALEEAIRALNFPSVPDECLYTYPGVQAVIHLFRVSAGIDSMVLGEGQILAQVKQALESARAAGSVGTVLNALLQQALSVGKRVRNETAVGEGTLSVARMAVEVAAQVFGASFGDVRALVVGAGETAELVARHLVDRGVDRLVFANRTPENGARLAVEFGAEVHGLDRLGELCNHADVVLPCVDGAPGLLSVDLLAGKELRRRDRPLVVLDLSVPRAVEPGVGDLKNLLLYDLDDLGSFVTENRLGRERALEGTSEILVAEVHKFLALRTFASFSPAIGELKTGFERVREEVLDQHSPTEGEHLRLAHDLTRRLLDVALHCMKEGARRSLHEEDLDRAYKRFLENL